MEKSGFSEYNYSSDEILRIDFTCMERGQSIFQKIEDIINDFPLILVTPPFSIKIERANESKRKRIIFTFGTKSLIIKESPLATTNFNGLFSGHPLQPISILGNFEVTSFNAEYFFGLLACAINDAELVYGGFRITSNSDIIYFTDDPSFIWNQLNGEDHHDDLFPRHNYFIIKNDREKAYSFREVSSKHTINDKLRRIKNDEFSRSISIYISRTRQNLACLEFHGFNDPFLSSHDVFIGFFF